MIVFQCCVRGVTARRLLILVLVIFFLNLLSVPEQSSQAATDTHVTSGDTRDKVIMRSKSMSKLKKPQGDRFQFELLEPRHLFSVSNGSAPALEHMASAGDVSFGHHVESSPSAETGLGSQADRALSNFLYLPMVSSGPNTTVNIGTPLQLNAEVIVNVESNLSLQWSKISGPGTATFSKANAANSTVQFDQPGTYVLQLAATNHGVTALSQLVVNATFVNAINIDQAWLDERGDGPYYLDQAGRTYVLQTDVTTDGTAFAIIAKDVTLDLNGHTITYNNATPIVIPNGSFEQGSGTAATGWNFANAPNAERFQGVWLHNEVYDGDYSLKFSDTTKNQYVTSTKTITLEPNTTYSLSAMFEMGGQGNYQNPGVKGYVRLIGANGEPTREVFYDGTNWRGIQHREGVFTTGDSKETYTIQVGIEGHADAAKPFYIDDIKIQRTQEYGVVVSPKNWNPGATPGVSRYGAATNATIKNGTLTQGQDGATWGHGVFIYATQGVTVDSLDITVSGANSSALQGRDMYSYPITINNNTLASNNRTVTNRDHFNGAVVHGLMGTITNNTITNGPHAGIVCSGRTTGTGSIVSGNTIRLKVKYTNAFAIIGDPYSQIFDNNIECGTGEYTSHGIGVPYGTQANPARVYNNTIAVQQLPGVNQEYEGIPIGGAFGMQIDSSPGTGESSADYYSEIYGNDITVYGTTNGYGFRLTLANSNVHIHDNTFRVLSTATGTATAFSPKGTNGNLLNIEDNTIITNSGIVGATADSNLVLRRTTLEVADPVENPWIFDVAYSSTPGVHSTITLLDTIYADGSAQTYVANATTKSEPIYSGNPNTGMTVSISWTTTITVKDTSNQPIAGATVTVKDKDDNEVYSGETDANGSVSAVLKEFQIHGATKTSYNDYTVTVTKGGDSKQQTFTADKKQTLTMQLGGTQQSIDQTSDTSQAGLSLAAFLMQRSARIEASTVTISDTAVMPVVVVNESQSLPTGIPTVNGSPLIPEQDSTDAEEETVAIDEAYAEFAEFLSRRALARQIL